MHRLFLFACLLASATGCKKTDGPMRVEDAGATAPAPVEVTDLFVGELENALRFSANLEAETQVQVIARTLGQVETLDVEEGQKVKAGDVLLRLDSAEQQSAVKRTQAELAQGKRTHQQRTRLQSHGVISDDEREMAEFDLKRLQIAAQDARRALLYTVVKAPVSGTITQRQVKLGDFVNPNQHLFSIVDFDTIIAKVYVPEANVGSVKVGQEVRLYAASEPGAPRKGIVDRIAPVIDPRTGTAKVTIRIPDTEMLRPGSFVTVELVTNRNETAVLLPKKALVYDNDEMYAFKVKNGPTPTVEKLRIDPVLEGEHYVEAAGLAVGDRVVVAGQVGLKDGALVEPKLVKQTQSENTATSP